MAPALLALCVWVLVAAVTAFLPMRRQYVPGIALLIAAPALMIWIGLSVGWVWAALGTAAFLSMLRNPLRYFWARARGERPEIPK